MKLLRLRLYRFVNGRHRLGILLAAGAILLSLRNSGLYASVFADEFTYSRFARLGRFSDAYLPNYLFSLVYRSTNLCGEGFLQCARQLNVAFFLAGVGLFYLSCKRVASRGVALLFSFLIFFSPFNTYTAYFMPESMYFFFFAALTSLLFIVPVPQMTVFRWLAVGAAIGLGALIKPHALFLLAPLAFYVGVSNRFNVQRTMKALTVTLVCALVVKFLFGFAMAGTDGISLFGKAYVSQTFSPATDNPQLLKTTLFSLSGQVLGIFSLFSVGCLVTVSGAVRFLKSCWFAEEPTEDSRYAFYTVLVLACLVLITAVFTAKMVGTGPYESANRIHARYYNFAFPLLLLTLAAKLRPQEVPLSGQLRIACAAVGLLILASAAYTRLGGFAPALADSPELYGMLRSPNLFLVCCVASGGAMVIWVSNARGGLVIFSAVVLPMIILISQLEAYSELRHRLVPDEYDRAGSFARRYLSEVERDKVLILSSSPAGGYKALFYLDSNAPFFESPPVAQPYNLESLPTGRDWLLAIGDLPVTRRPETTVIAMRGFTLYGRAPSGAPE